MSAFRSRLDRIFDQIIGAQGKKQTTRMHLDDTLLECFSRLSPKCRDEELEDLVYFILDLYQFHGVQVAIAEVDVDHVVVDLRTALEEHAARVRGRASLQEDQHVFLVLNRCLQEIPWESLPILRGRSVSRIPNVDFLVDRLEFARRRDQSTGPNSDQYEGRTRLDLSSTYYILNPSGDLESTERRFSPWLRSMRDVGWDGIIGRIPSEQEFTHALEKNELLMYVYLLSLSARPFLISFLQLFWSRRWGTVHTVAQDSTLASVCGHHALGLFLRFTAGHGRIRPHRDAVQLHACRMVTWPFPHFISPLPFS